MVALPNPMNFAEVHAALKEAAGQGPMGPIQLELGGKTILVTGSAHAQALEFYKAHALERYTERLKQLDKYIASSDERLRAALIDNKNFATKWWNRKRIGLLDPHVLDQPRAHAAAARGAIERNDFLNAAASIKAGVELVDLAEERLHQFWTGIDRIDEDRL